MSLIFLLIISSSSSTLALLGILSLDTAWATTTVWWPQREVNVLLTVQTNHKGGDVHHLLAHTGGEREKDLNTHSFPGTNALKSFSHLNSWIWFWIQGVVTLHIPSFWQWRWVHHFTFTAGFIDEEFVTPQKIWTYSLNHQPEYSAHTTLQTAQCIHFSVELTKLPEVQSPIPYLRQPQHQWHSPSPQWQDWLWAMSIDKVYGFDTELTLMIC